MLSTPNAHPFEYELGALEALGTTVGQPTDARRACLLRHLVVAAEEIASERRYEPDATRYMAVAARLRDMGLERDGESDGPWIASSTGGRQPLLGLLAEAWEGQGGRFPTHGIDPSLLEAAVELLRGFVWQVPDGVDWLG